MPGATPSDPFSRVLFPRSPLPSLPVHPRARAPGVFLVPPNARRSGCRGAKGEKEKLLSKRRQDECHSAKDLPSALTSRFSEARVEPSAGKSVGSSMHHCRSSPTVRTPPPTKIRDPSAVEWTLVSVFPPLPGIVGPPPVGGTGRPGGSGFGNRPGWVVLTQLRSKIAPAHDLLDSAQAQSASGKTRVRRPLDACCRVHSPTGRRVGAMGCTPLRASRR